MQNVSLSKAWLMWFAASLFYAYQYVLRVIPNILMPDLINHFNTSSAEFGQFAGLYYIGYAGAHIPLGIWLDRQNPKIVIPACIMITIAGVLPLLLSDQIIAANVGRLIMGIGSSGAILGAFKVIRLGFAENHFNRMLGLCVTIGLLGALYGGLPVSCMLEKASWQTVISVICLVGIALAVVTYLVIPSAYIKAQTSKNILHDVKQVLTNKNVLMVCICSGLMVGPLEGFADVWGAGFLQSVYKINLAYAAGMTSLIFLGMCIGSSGLTYLADKLQTHMKVIIVCGLFMAMAFIYMLTEQASVSFLSPLFVAIGFCCAYQIIGIYMASTFVAEKFVGITTAVANMIIMTFGYFFHSTIGLAMGKHQANGMFLAEQYKIGLAVIPISLLIACIGFFYLDSKNKK
jgi:predicted MFS family arabinose efflux permease